MNFLSCFVFWGCILLVHTTPGITAAMTRLEELIRMKLIPVMGGRDITDELRMILQLPTRMENMGFPYPSDESKWEY